tara:strand:+ start:3379 stop:4416 length:1038 start_codon:yes stop_codon:yes gene_type:complete
MRKEIQEESIKIALESWKGGTLDVAVRAGKTFIGLSIASKFNNVLVSYPNNSIKDSWISDAEKFGFSLKNITFTTHVSLNKLNLSAFSCIILDEIDQISEAQWLHIIKSAYPKLYGLTGTPPISGFKKKYMDEFCPIIYSVKLDDTVGILQKNYKIIVHLLEPSHKVDIPLKSGKFWSEKSKIQFWENKYNRSHEFMDMLKLIQSIQNSKTKLDYVKQLSSKIDRCLIFLETTKQCDELPYYSYHSKIKTAEDNLSSFQKMEINKLSCVKQLSAGITFKALNECIILHAYASNNKTHQRLARCLNYVEGETATIHIICLNNTRDVEWVKKGLAEFNQSKILWKTI